jgi:glutamate synthase (NADPH) large chain
MEFCMLSNRPALDTFRERDACGFGLIAQLDDHASHAVVTAALTALKRLSHRGAISADGLSGDGCGLMLRRPESFVRNTAAEVGITLGNRFASGLVFLPQDQAKAAQCREALQASAQRNGLRVLGWRVVPVDLSACGPEALRSLPQIEQVFVQPASSAFDPEFATRLFVARRQVEIELLAQPDFYVVSLSANRFTFKAMVRPDYLDVFYPDLKRPDLLASAALFHQRFSTNTLPRWPLAHPFRVLAHNGEINSIEGNRLWMRARGADLSSPMVDFSQLQPIVSETGSDSQSLDQMLEALIIGGMDLLQAMRILIPPAWRDNEAMDADLKAFYEYYALPMEPWDGPAGVVMLDHRYAACTLDRNGLRPARFLLTRDRTLVMSSEAGVFDVAASDVVRKGRVGAGQMIAVDFERGVMLESADVDAVNRARAPFKRWLKAGVRYLHSDLIDPGLAAEPWPHEKLLCYQKLFGVSREERDTILKTLAEAEAEATGSMGDDTPMAAISGHDRSLYDYFRQAFAQVTNPPMDPLREHKVMSLVTQIGAEHNLFELSAENARQIVLNSPVLSQRKLRQLLDLKDSAFQSVLLDLHYPKNGDLPSALDALCIRAEQEVRAGKVLIVLSDANAGAEHLTIHALMAVGAVHHHLIERGLRTRCNVIVETATARDPHHFACLIGYGATAVYPYLAYQSLYALKAAGQIHAKVGDERQLGRSYRRGIRKGLLKIIAKMGISTLDSYRGAQLFEIVGLSEHVVQRCFHGTPSRISGVSWPQIQAEQAERSQRAFDPNIDIDHGGLLKFSHGGEAHAYGPDVVIALQQAVKSDDPADYQIYAKLVNERRPLALRDLLELYSDRAPIDISLVEPASALFKRFDSAAMSLGALSPEAHEALAIAMNRLGGRSNSGEGGEDPLRHGTEKSSKIKQVASARFGVTPDYLVSAEVLQIKVAQGAKPGEGGQLPGHKVNELIARLRYAKPGIGLISPPPHHDIYSIEDLAQLIFDLKQVNPSALVSVKLVAHAGVGTIAAGVAKAHADLITISGHDGGTGASPVSSIKYAGAPWELGLAEAQQTLRRHGLRDRVRVQVDGGFKTGLDVIKAAALGAESFGFGTAPMIALGCKYLRICHLNSCATGIATQNSTLRKLHFKGLPERVMSYFTFVAEEVRQHLAGLGLRSLEELIGRTEYLRPIAAVDAEKYGLIDVAPLLSQNGLLADDRSCCVSNPTPDAGALASKIDLDTASTLSTGGAYDYHISNRDRSIGARVSGEIARRFGADGAPALTQLRFQGAAGQSFGAWNAKGLQLELTGEANDYVGKGMAGGRIVIRPPADAGFGQKESTIIGNTCLYGATGGELYAAGQAGERFAVRNSGAVAVIEGAGDHACEYMTGGVVVILGAIGSNLGAGMTGGIAYALDHERDFVDRYNHELVDILRLSPEGLEHHVQHLHRLLVQHLQLTGSVQAGKIVDDFREFLGKFWLIKPKASSLESLVDTLKRAA